MSSESERLRLSAARLAEATAGSSTFRQRSWRRAEAVSGIVAGCVVLAAPDRATQLFAVLLGVALLFLGQFGSDIAEPQLHHSGCNSRTAVPHSSYREIPCSGGQVIPLSRVLADEPDNLVSGGSRRGNVRHSSRLLESIR